jgi:hypothetical protein
MAVGISIGAAYASSIVHSRPRNASNTFASMSPSLFDDVRRARRLGEGFCDEVRPLVFTVSITRLWRRRHLHAVAHQ